jgi:hypothetical protein
MTAISIADRILDAFPSGDYGLLALLRLLDIVETTEVDTAAVECTSMPRLLINPQFVDAHAATPERLLMLVMHELHHVLLGHTRLFPRATRTDNVIFDAVINALLCRMFPQPEHTSFFTCFYSDERFPECLLRPPAGWLPSSPAPMPPALDSDAMRHVQAVYRALYSETGANYQELYDALRRALPLLDGLRLIGSHGAEPAELEGLVFDTVRSIVENWPQPPDPIRGRSWSDLLRLERVRVRRCNRRILRELIWKVAGSRGSALTRFHSPGITQSVTPIPSGDRRSVVLRALDLPQLIYRAESAGRVRVRCDRVHVYVDVSGSIADFKGALYGSLLDCCDVVHPAVHLFSTAVHDVSFGGLRKGECRTTGGTSIECVASHIEKHGVRRAVLLTDGWVGCPGTGAAQTLAGVRLGVALTPDANRSDLNQFVRHWAELEMGDKQ